MTVKSPEVPGSNALRTRHTQIPVTATVTTQTNTGIVYNKLSFISEYVHNCTMYIQQKNQTQRTG